jgi:putative ABC transport system permease protein
MARDLWHMKWRAVAIVLTIASGVAIYTGIHTGLLSLVWTRDSIHRELNFADLEIRFLPDDARNLPELSAVEGVARLERRLVLPGTLRLPGAAPLTTVMTFLEHPRPSIHSFKLVAGRLFGEDELDAAVIDVGLATHHGRKVGDVLEVKVGEATYRRRVVGIVLTPEYFVATSHPAYFLPARGSLGAVFAHLESITDALGFTLVNDLVFRYQDGADAAAVKRRLLARASKLNIQDVLARDRHFAYRYVQSQLEGVGAFVPAIVLVLLALTFIVVSVNVHRMIAVDRPQIGALMALGYAPSRVLRAYLEAVLALGVVAAGLGVGLSFVVRDLFATVSAASMGMPEIRTTTEVATMARGVVYPLAAALLATAWPVHRLVRRSPHDVMRPSPRPLTGFRTASAGGLAGLVRRLPAAPRHAVRSLARQRSRALGTLAAIALGLGVATAYRLSLGALDTTLSGWLADDPWDLAVDFLYPTPVERMAEVRALPAVTRAEPYFACYVELHAGRRIADSSLLGLVPDSDMTTLKLAEGRPFGTGREREAILTRDLSRRLGLGIGDVFEVHAMTERYPVRLVGLNWAAVGGLSLVALPVAQEICQFPGKASGAYLQTAGDAARPHELDFVGRVLAKRDLSTQVKELLGVMIAVLDLATAVSILVGMLVILTSISLSVLDNDRDFATLQALGYSRRLIGTIVLSEAAVYVVAAAALSLPIALATSLYLNHRMSTAWVQIDNSVRVSAFVAVLVPGLACVPLGCLPALRYILSRDVLTSLRQRTLE